MVKFIVSAVFATLALAGGVLFFQLATPPGKPDETAIFEVKPGQSFGHVAQDLQAQGLIHNAKLLKAYARLTGAAANVKVGEYEVNRGMSPRAILAVLVSGKSITRPITFPEGLNIFEIAKLVAERGLSSEAEFLALTKDPALIKQLLGEDRSSLEGYLFPETYMVTKYTSARELISSMVARFQQVYQEAVEPLKPQMKLHQVVALASIIEKETGAPEERPMISSVFHNRLAQGMKLQSDPTIIYGLMAKTGQPVLNITKEDILSDTPYNTYVVPALPAGPIANPGREALVAAVKPAKSEFLYFVSRNDGTHVFTSTYEDHSSAVKKFQLDSRAREGKSWRDRLNNKKDESVTKGG